MNRLLQLKQEKHRLITAEDGLLVAELQLRWSEQRNQLKSLERQPNRIAEEFAIKYARLDLLRRAAHRLKQLAEADHQHLYGEVVQ